MALFEIAVDHGKFHNPEKFGDLGGGLYELKSFQIRIPFALRERAWPDSDYTRVYQEERQGFEGGVARAWRIFEEDQSATKLAVVPKPGSERAVQKAKK